MSVFGALLVEGGLIARHRVEDAFAGVLGIQQAVADVPGVRQSAVSSVRRVGVVRLKVQPQA